MTAVGTAVGIVANPASGRDIRRLVAGASVFPTAEKANMVQRILTALATVNVTTAYVSVDLGGISAKVLRAVDHRPAHAAPWPEVRFVDDDAITGRAEDTTNAVHRMTAAGATVIICLGGDGTARVATAALLDGPGQDIPLLPLSTGTNNTFPELREATVAGLAAGLVATGAVDAAQATSRAAVLEVIHGDRTEPALVDVGVATARHVGARALWDPASLTELYCTFAEPDAVGLSSVPGLLGPSPRDKPDGVALRLCPVEDAPTVVRAPIAPGLVLPVGVAEWRPLRVGERVEVTTRTGVVAVVGEREIELHDGPPAVVRLRGDGPRRVDVTAVMELAARSGLFRRSAGRSGKDSQR